VISESALDIWQVRVSSPGFVEFSTSILPWVSAHYSDALGVTFISLNTIAGLIKHLVHERTIDKQSERTFVLDVLRALRDHDSGGAKSIAEIEDKLKVDGEEFTDRLRGYAIDSAVKHVERVTRKGKIKGADARRVK
jgi:hypothetical protein